MTAAIPDPALVVLVGPSGSGKSTWAGARYRSQEIVSSDALRGVVGSGPHDLDASEDAFALLDTIVDARLRRGLTTVVDTLGLDRTRRLSQLDAARRAGLPGVAVVFDTDAAECRRRNRERDRSVPAAVLDRQLAKLREVSNAVDAEGWDVAIHLDTSGPQGDTDVRVSGSATRDAPVAGPRAAARSQRQLGFVLHVSEFPWGEDPASWLTEVAQAAAEAGFEGLAVMDHLIQIPQVGRAWDPLPEAFVTLGMLAGVLHSAGTPLRLGALVSPVTFRRPGVVAKAVATLDVMTGGQAFCGVGAGWFEREHRGFGLEFPAAAERLDQLEAGIETMRALWAAGTKAYAGDLVSLPETTSYPRPLGHVPVIVGGSGGRRTLRIAARLGDGVNLPSSVETLDTKLGVLRRHCADVGRDPDDVEITVLDLPVVASDRDRVAAAVERLRGRRAAAAYAKRHHAGIPEAQVERYRALADRGVRTVFVAPQGFTGPRDVEVFASITAAFG